MRYEVKNTTSADIFLFNQLYADIDQQGRYKVDASICHIEVQHDRILVSKNIAEVPANMLVEARNIPCMTSVAAGASLNETVQLPVPLSQWTPYIDGPARPRIALLPVFFQVGYFIAAGNAVNLASKVATSAGVAMHFAPFSMSSQRLLTVGPFDPVQVFV